ncbi:hypothetical protein RA280_44995 [Cupriavidus sp. CV2]|uniref:hypothetical protein n=1 Tax=Cupriavidus ulmosensis TaxID=3065913 RepID=UPI00296B51F2|nr:hypothetical protein [Cupriavidus sp. CV2]MDW3688755.1 hypothetical protein [Cupriavidus sp. CV2]
MNAPMRIVRAAVISVTALVATPVFSQYAQVAAPIAQVAAPIFSALNFTLSALDSI